MNANDWAFVSAGAVGACAAFGHWSAAVFWLVVGVIALWRDSR